MSGLLPAALGKDLPSLVLSSGRFRADVRDAVINGELMRDLDGASTLTVGLHDPHRLLVRQTPQWRRTVVAVDGIGFELVQVRKTGSGLSLTFEDAVVAKLRRYDRALVVAAGTTTRQEFAARLAREAGVGYVGQTDELLTGRKRGRSPVRNQFGRGTISSKGTPEQRESSWDATGRLFSDIGQRRFSDGQRLVTGSDHWLYALTVPTVIREHTGPVDDVDFDFDTGKPANTASFTVDASRWAYPPAHPLLFEDLGVGDGRWLVQTVTRPLFSVRATVTATRGKADLPEPPKEAVQATRDTTLTIEGVGNIKATGAAAKAIEFAESKIGTDYLFGGTGPRYDCSGLTSKAWAAAGVTIPRTAAAQQAALPKVTSVQPGDILFFGVPAHHCGLALGGGRMLEAAHTGTKVRIVGGATTRKDYTGAGRPGG